MELGRVDQRCGISVFEVEAGPANTHHHGCGKFTDQVRYQPSIEQLPHGTMVVVSPEEYIFFF